MSSFDTLEDARAMLDECENCPVVFLHDKAEDVANFLAALYDGPYVESRTKSRSTHLTLIVQQFWKQRPGGFPRCIWGPSSIHKIYSGLATSQGSHP
jgi:hypothetical protein